MSGTSSTLASLSSSSNASTSKLANTSTTASMGNINSNEWLTLLTTQLQYQDPLSPSDPTQFVSELAQFNAVQQQTQTNTTLSSMLSALSGNSLSQSASLIGHSVQAPATSYTASGTTSPTDYKYSVSNSALANVQLQVTNSNGSVVSTQAVSGSGGTVSFSGTDATGNALPAGTYTVKLIGTDSSGNTQSAGTLTSSGKVTSVIQNSASGAELQLDNGSVVQASTVSQLGA